jgi:RHS repeat-associated protein
MTVKNQTGYSTITKYFSGSYEKKITTPTLSDHGFTGYERLDSYGLINMNGRMYDPVIGRFLGVDPFVVDGNNSQSINSYTYALNNPLGLIDRDGFKAEEPYYGGSINGHSTA